MLDKHKLKALVHHLCSQGGGREGLEAAELHKILWLADMLAFQHFGTSITNEVYIKRPFGPFSTHLAAVVRELEHEGRLTVHTFEAAGGRTRTEYRATAEMQESSLSADETALVNDVRNYVCQGRAIGKITDPAHDEVLRMALPDEPIPYAAILVASLDPPTKDDLAWAQAEIGKLR